MEINVKVIAIIQARLGATRLPGKVLKSLEGKPMLQQIIERISMSKYIDKIIVATTVSPNDDALADFVKNQLKLEFTRGSDDDVLDRFYQASVEFPSDYIVRITADDPLKDAEIIDECIKELLKNPDLDYCSNTIKPTYPEGLDIEVFKSSALKKAYLEASKQSEREHVTPYIWKNQGKFNIKNIEFEKDLSAWRWTVDKPQDFEFMQVIFEHFKGNNTFSYKDAIKYIENNLDLLEINSGTIRNEGYIKSIKEDL